MPSIRLATLSDALHISALIERSARALMGDDYTAAQVEGALRGAFGLDTQLIVDGSYFVAEHEGGLVACGGWSRRRTLFGGDARAERDATQLNPHVDAARIRAFFVDPRWARRGLGRALLERCETAAQAYGFRRCELMATLPGERLYAACGYEAQPRVRYPVGENLDIEFTPMVKALPSAETSPEALLSVQSGRSD